MIYQLVLFVAFLGCVVNGQISSCGSLSPNITKCNDATPIADVPTLNEDNIIDPTKYLNLTIICSSTRLADYKKAASCVLNSYRHCGDNDYKTLVLTETEYKAAIDYACNNIEPIYHVLSCIGDSVKDCISNRQAREKRTTGSKPDISQPFSDFREYFCGRRQIERECAETDEDFLACVEPGTAAIYLEYLTKMTPAGCGATSIFIASSLLLVSLLSTFIKYL